MDAISRHDLDALLAMVLERQASDLHLMAGQPPIARVHGELRPLDSHPLTPADLERFSALLTAEQGESGLRDHGALDVGYSLGGERFRVNLFHSMGRLGLVARHLDSRFRGFGELGLPATLAGFADLNDGLVLVTGATGSGKSTTLATLVHEINRQHARHILTVEDPVEFVHAPIRSHITHRELHRDFPDFASAVKSALRQDPDVILIGEMRDLETMRAALTAAETGHLVFGTLHTADTVGTVERLVGGFPGDEQDMVRYRLSRCLRAVVSQRLIPRSNGRGRTALVEVLVVTNAVSNLIATGRTKQIYSAIEGGAELGMQTFDHGLADAVRDGRVAPDAARRLASDPALLERLLDTRNGARHGRQ
jgi:twitching motility protein PilT